MRHIASALLNCTTRSAQRLGQKVRSQMFPDVSGAYASGAAPDSNVAHHLYLAQLHHLARETVQQLKEPVHEKEHS
jgi:hypothetical protein